VADYSSQKRKAPLGTRGASYMLVPGKGPGNGEFSRRHNIVLIATGDLLTIPEPRMPKPAMPKSALPKSVPGSAGS